MRRKATQRELEERLLADPVAQVLLGDRAYARSISAGLIDSAIEVGRGEGS